MHRLSDPELVLRYEAGETMTALAAASGESQPTISRRLKKLGVAVRPWSRVGNKTPGHLRPRRQPTTEEVAQRLEMKRRYEAGESAGSIAESMNLVDDTVLYHLKRQGVVIRPKGQVPNSVAVGEELLELLDGLLLGDGGLALHGTEKTPHYSMSQSLAQVAWVEWLRGRFESLGVSSRVSTLSPTHIRGEARQLNSLTYVELREQHERWYRPMSEEERKADPKHRYWRKVVPIDVRLSPLALSQWYFGDGTVTGGRVKFCTHGFTKEECAFLAQRLRSLYGWRARVGRDGKYHVVWIRWKEDVRSLWETVRPYEPGCFAYKLGPTHQEPLTSPASRSAVFCVSVES